MGNPTGFLQSLRTPVQKREVEARLQDHRELPVVHEESHFLEQGGRCMDCGVPFCMQGCPLGNPIPDFNDRVHQSQWKRAYVALSSTNNFPEFTGRLCPAPCEAACVLGLDNQAVTIEDIEKEIIEYAFRSGWVTPAIPEHRSGKKVAVIGSGPAGLAAAQQLNRAGHLVTVFEQAEQLGGLLRFGIPDFKLDKEVIDRRIRLLEAEGIEFRCGVSVGTDLSFESLRASYDAVVLAIGARRPRTLEVPGVSLPGVMQAMDYLEAQNRALASSPTGTVAPGFSAKDKSVIVLGGGDTGSDCVGTALRQGASHVLQVELMPAPPEKRAHNNPWPQWPLVFRTSSSQEEGGARAFAMQTTHLSGEDGRLTHLHAIPVVYDPATGRLQKAEGEAQTFPVDMLILAMGFIGPSVDEMVECSGLGLDSRGNVAAESGFATNLPGVFVAGDAKRGASLIVWAIAEGRECAREVDTWLMQTPSRLPSRGADAPFGGR